MAYSNNTPEWDGTQVTTGNKVGWRGQIWTALITTTSEPYPSNTDWELDTPLHVTGFGIAEIPDPFDFLHVRMFGFGIAEEHINRPPAVMMHGWGLVQYRPGSYYDVIFID